MNRTRQLRWRFAAVPFLMSLLLLLPSITRSAPADSTSFVIRGAKVFDGVKDRGVMDVLVQNGLIAATGKSVKAPAGTREIDGKGKTLMPGLIDAHVHAFGDALRNAIVFGSTTELDQFTSIAMAEEVRKHQANGEMTDVADLYSAGTLVTAPKGHGTEYGMPIPTLAPGDDAQKFVDARIAEGSQWIKIIYDNGSPYGLTIPTLTKAQLKAVIDAAHARGKLAVCHIGDLAGARDAIECGADGLAHLFVDAPPDPEFGKFVAQHKAFVIATLTVLESVSATASGSSLVTDPALSPWINQGAAGNLKRSFPARAGSTLKYENAELAIRALKAAGVPILAGTDAPNPGTWYGVSMHRELELLVHAGLTPSEALAAGTSVPADKFRLADRGRIAPGLRADLLLVNGDPTADIKATRNLAGIWKRGIAVDRTKEKNAVAEEARAAAAPPDTTVPGNVSDFESGSAISGLGSSWTISTDQMMGGKSVATMNVVAGGANGTTKALEVKGTLDPASTFGWSGAMLFTGNSPMAPRNLAAKHEIRFWTRGDGRKYTLMVFSKSAGPRPLVQSFTAGPQWAEVVMKFSDFGTDGHDLQGMEWAATAGPGTFAFQIDEVRLQ